MSVLHLKTEFHPLYEISFRSPKKSIYPQRISVMFSLTSQLTAIKINIEMQQHNYLPFSILESVLKTGFLYSKR